MDNEYRKAANITVILAGLFILCWLFFKYAVSALAPFLLALMISAAISPIVDKIASKTRLPRRFCSAAVLTVSLVLIMTLTDFLVSRLILELGELMRGLSENPEMIGQTIESIKEKFFGEGSPLAFLPRLFESGAFVELGLDADLIIRDAVGSMISSLSATIPSLAVSVVKSVPSVILFIMVLFIAAYYFSADKGKIFGGLEHILPEKWRKKIPTVKGKLKSILTGYLKAYFVIMLITFCETLIGFLIMGVEYAFLMATLVAFVDILPIFGAGTVLIPWAVFSLLTSNTPLGIGLLVLYAVTLVVRQFIEPKIVGTTLGIHPLATLASVYLGLSFFGFWGLILGPMSVLIIREVFFSKKEEQGTEIVVAQKKDSSV